MLTAARGLHTFAHGPAKRSMAEPRMSAFAMKKTPTQPMPLPGAPPPDQPDCPTHQPIDPDDGAPVAPQPDEEGDAQWKPPR